MASSWSRVPRPGMRHILCATGLAVLVSIGAAGCSKQAVREKPLPDPQPGRGEALVQMRAVSLNYRDLLVVKGVYNPKMNLPRVPASDGVGEVVAVGPDVSRVKVGTRVCGLFMPKWLEGELTDAKA